PVLGGQRTVGGERGQVRRQPGRLRQALRQRPGQRARVDALRLVEHPAAPVERDGERKDHHLLGHVQPLPDPPGKVYYRGGRAANYLPFVGFPVAGGAAGGTGGGPSGSNSWMVPRLIQSQKKAFCASRSLPKTVSPAAPSNGFFLCASASRRSSRVCWG